MLVACLRRLVSKQIVNLGTVALTALLRGSDFAFITMFWLGFCTASSASEAATQTRELSQVGHLRTYSFYRPAHVTKDKLVPLVIMLHGGFGSGAQAEKSYGWNAMADQGGFVVAFPDGIGRSWNAGGTCCGRAQREGIDDVGFLSELIDSLIAGEHVDPRQIYLTGMSNGAAMAYRYGCEGPRTIAAIGSVSGSFSYECPHPRAVSLMEIHGAEDHNIPLQDGLGQKGVSHVSWQAVAQSVDWFRKAAGCRAPVETQDGSVIAQSSICADGKAVSFLTVQGAGHQWPGSRGAPPFARAILPLDPPSQALDATSLLWAFFQQHHAQ